MRSKTLLTIALASTALLMVAGCSKPIEGNSPASKSDVATASDKAGTNLAESSPAASQVGPDVGPAPGIAFRYDYKFSLPANVISSVQQQHANACQRLGASRCRVTGLSYEQPNKDEVSAKMSFLLAPDIAHSFANDAVGAVERADGKLDFASVNGEDAGTEITFSQENSAAIQAEVERIGERLVAKGITKEERYTLTQKVEELREQLRSEAGSRSAKEKSIASTPVSFEYSTSGVIGTSNAFGKAAATSWNSMANMLSVLLLVLAYALPWLLPIGVGVLIWRYRQAKKNLAQSADMSPSTNVFVDSVST